jgi:hypothetical protein
MPEDRMRTRDEWIEYFGEGATRDHSVELLSLLEYKKTGLIPARFVGGTKLDKPDKLDGQAKKESETEPKESAKSAKSAKPNESEKAMFGHDFDFYFARATELFADGETPFDVYR